MKQRTSQIIYGYWNDVRGSRLAPSRLEIEPGRIAEILSETFILEDNDDGCYVFRLAGTRICDQLGRELRGTPFLQLAGDEGREAMDDCLHQVTTRGAVGVFELAMHTVDGRSVSFEAIVLPLLHTGKAVSRYLGAMSVINPPIWLGTSPLLPGTLAAHDVVWPDGRPHAVIERGRTEPPFRPMVTAARIVKSHRRQFRVFEGGRKDERPVGRLK